MSGPQLESLLNKYENTRRRWYEGNEKKFSTRCYDTSNPDEEYSINPYPKRPLSIRRMTDWFTLNKKPRLTRARDYGSAIEIATCKIHSTEESIKRWKERQRLVDELFEKDKLNNKDI